MPQSFDLTSLVSKDISKKSIKKRHRQSREKPFVFPKSFIEFVELFSTRLWSGFYILLALASFFTGIFVEKTNLAKNIMNGVRSRQQAAAPQVKIEDFSSYSITTTNGLVAFVTYPTGDRVGDTAEGVRYLEVKNVSLTSSSSSTSSASLDSMKSWGLVAKKPYSGEYLVDFSSRYPGTYQYTLNTYDTTGANKVVISDQITITTPYEHHLYSFSYNKQNPDFIRFLFQKTVTKNSLSSSAIITRSKHSHKLPQYQRDYRFRRTSPSHI